MKKITLYTISVGNKNWTLEVLYDETDKTITEIIEDIKDEIKEMSKSASNIFGNLDEINRLLILYREKNTLELNFIKG